MAFPGLPMLQTRLPRLSFDAGRRVRLAEGVAAIAPRAFVWLLACTGRGPRAGALARVPGLPRADLPTRAHERRPAGPGRR